MTSVDLLFARPISAVSELGVSRRLVAGRDDDVRVVGILAQHIEFPGTVVTKSPAATTYAAGPIADPWIILAVSEAVRTFLREIR